MRYPDRVKNTETPMYPAGIHGIAGVEEQHQHERQSAHSVERRLPFHRHGRILTNTPARD